MAGFSTNRRLPGFPKSLRRLSRSLPAVLVAAALVWTAGGTLSVYPHQLAYFNELAGGPEEGHRHLLGSSLDWGQDLLHLMKWRREHPEVRPLWLLYDGQFQPDDLGAGHDQISPSATSAFSEPGWYAVSLSWLAKRPAVASQSRARILDTWAEYRVAGYSISVFHWAPGVPHYLRRKGLDDA